MKQPDNHLISAVLNILENEFTLQCEFIDDQFLTIGTTSQRKKFQVITFSSLSVASAEMIPENNGDLLVITWKIGKKVSEVLRSKGVFFVDTFGNAFIRTEDIFLDIRGRTKSGLKSHLNSEKLRLEKMGIQLLIAFFSNPEILNKNYREIAQLTGCSLGYVSKFIKKLRATGFVVKSESGQLNMVNKHELLQRLKFEYRTSLKDKYFVGRYEMNKNVHPQNSNSENYSIYFTSGKAVEMKFGNLREKITELYLDGELKDFIKFNRLIPDKNGNLIVYQKYWNFEHASMIQKISPDFIVYLDLITSADQRLMDAAEGFYAE
ncbi:MAG: hypothetical protein IPJ75_14585 [Ignavibacteriales bacterium]|nr:hypothetical protein [Ignavibacteriales bacterium]